jgi:hypothetical protein
MASTGITNPSLEPLTPRGWLWYFAADATCVGGYGLTVFLEPSAWRRAGLWWLSTLLLPVLAPTLPRALLLGATVAGVAGTPLLLQTPALRFIYGMAGLFRALRLLVLLRDPFAMGEAATSQPGGGSGRSNVRGSMSRRQRCVLRAAVLWGYHDVRALKPTAGWPNAGGPQRTCRLHEVVKDALVRSVAPYAVITAAAHLLLPIIHARARAAGSASRGGSAINAAVRLCWEIARLTLGTVRLWSSMALLSGAVSPGVSLSLSANIHLDVLNNSYNRMCL